MFTIIILIFVFMIIIIIDARINGYGFLSLNESRLERLGVSFGFQISLMNIIEGLVCDYVYTQAGICNSCTMGF